MTLRHLAQDTVPEVRRATERLMRLLDPVTAN